MHRSSFCAGSGRRRRRWGSASAIRRSSRRTAARSDRRTHCSTGRRATSRTTASGSSAGLPEEVEVGRYHSLAATVVPDVLHVTARTEDGEVMASAPRRPSRRRRPVPSRERAHAARRADGGELPLVIVAAISAIADGRDLSRAEAREVMGFVMRGEATPAQIGGLLDRAAHEGRDGRGDHGLRGGDARARRPGHAHPYADRRRRRDGGRRGEDVQHLDRRRRRRGSGGRRGREARQPRRELGLWLGGRARGARLCARASARQDRRLDRRARLRVHVRARPPSGDAPRCAGAAGAGNPHGLQRARAAREPGGRAGRRLRRVRARSSRARTQRRWPGSVRAARSSSTAAAGSTS